jgi:hypothetical protein
VVVHARMEMEIELIALLFHWGKGIDFYPHFYRLLNLDLFGLSLSS